MSIHIYYLGMLFHDNSKNILDCRSYLMGNFLPEALLLNKEIRKQGVISRGLRGAELPW